MDDIDRAQAREEEMREDAIAGLMRRLQAKRAESAEWCDDCGMAIPEERRQAVPGCRHCVECQEYAEQAARMGL